MATGIDFNSITSLDSMSKDMLISAYNAISNVEGGWDFLATYSPPKDEGFMFVNPMPPMLQKIHDAVLEAESGHSGASYGWTMRQIEYIAKNGWDAFVSLHDEDDESRLKKKVAKLEDENAKLRAQIHALSKKNWQAEQEREQMAKEDKPLAPLTQAIQNLASIDTNLTKAGVKNPSPLDIAEASRGVPGFEGQADAMTRFAEGKMTYAEMRSLCG